jgi:hypothetical protein
LAARVVGYMLVMPLDSLLMLVTVNQAKAKTYFGFGTTVAGAERCSVVDLVGAGMECNCSFDRPEAACSPKAADSGFVPCCCACWGRLTARKSNFRVDLRASQSTEGERARARAKASI